MARNSILAIGDLHIPFNHPKYLDFCRRIQDRVKTEHTIFIGDLVDNCAVSTKFKPNPNGLSPIDEMERADKELVKWFRNFPDALLCIGNHDTRHSTAAFEARIPDRVLKSFHNIWNLPKGWKDAPEHELFGVKFIHGTGYSGDLAMLKAAQAYRQSVVMGHIHHLCATFYTASSRDCIYGCATGCGISVKEYAFMYERPFPRKPLLGCAVITDSGKNCQVFRMEL